MVSVSSLSQHPIIMMTFTIRGGSHPHTGAGGLGSLYFGVMCIFTHAHALRV